ncbi:MAG: hypothetical protein IE912_10910 [Brevundimonas diminuta]|nr:hypothetical protein [Brevundimonas diminuta]MBD3819389.1 hypothetical protein [Brevundimonas diminuta]
MSLTTQEQAGSTAGAPNVYDLDLAAGIPVVARPSPADLREARRLALVGLDLFPCFGKEPRPALWEERQWLSAYRRAGCDIRCESGSSFAYIMPDAVIDEGIRLLNWLEAAEGRAPGISYRVHSLAVNADGVATALRNLKARRASQKAAA